MGARHLLAADLDDAAGALGVAFADDPMMAWLAGDDSSDVRAERSAQGFFAPALAAGHPRGHVYGIRGDNGFDAVAVWSPPDVQMLDESNAEPFIGAFLQVYGEEALERLGALGALTGELHPSEPHFYLFIVGAAVKGRGAGAAVIEPVLSRCDDDGLPIYLESSNKRNVSFYERIGFRSLWEEVPAEGGPLLTGMWRDPQPRR